MKRLYTGNVVYGSLPEGCKLCLRGLKSVVFVTGICPRSCFYCPINNEKKGRDVIYVNEKPVDDISKIVVEVALSGSRGIGLTGGDPLFKLDRLIAIVKTVKKVFGPKFHVHLYTTGKNLTLNTLELLESLNIDELRIHPDPSDMERILNLIENYNKDTLKIGFEIPIFPNNLNNLINLIDKISRYRNVNFINVNELEFSESNSAELKARGYSISDDWKTAEGSHTTAIQFLHEIELRSPKLNVHYCPANSKDNYQVRLRWYRRGILTARSHEIVSDEGTILKAIISETCERIPSTLVVKGHIGSETSLVLAESYGAEYRLVEELPDYKRTLLNIL
ncbi:MAG: radical SAM protein [Thermofilaceae archaeon]|nr:radical SAM protein [Thermofilaceae archaeon]